MLTHIDIFDPSSYPTRRQEEWKYSDLSRALRVVPPTSDVHRHSETVTVPAGETVTRFDVYDTSAPVVHEDLRFTLGEGASLTRIVILDEAETTVSIRQSIVETAPGSVFRQYVFSTGAHFQRFETHVNHAGHGAQVELHGAYLLKDKRHFDLTTRVNHSDVDGVTQQLIKGLVKDQATAVFQGRILVEKGADGTDARMRHQALILNDGAHIRAKPELEIYADDVQCAHGNTIGALDEEALFFCQSRGIPEDMARAMLTHAFVLPVADQIEDEGLRARVLSFLENASGDFHAL
ncbi:Fe-S cluster assembly protein SufD [Asticcacaulis sp. 201]|uniref:Fe-S cluster assembly protein SufD n=1 Tax=Asticcacaulis sp. 201 TaxID=3028787 RepID=UPI0029170CDB|nr:Fe-S cluster assembly protein SufD [Asticcacaulis sp. 201]MDV6329446.1 Fe-S cluster assembly protein SufD [Asticcacaulis sp. 201]